AAHRQIRVADERGRFIRACPPNLSIRHQSLLARFTENLPPFRTRTGIVYLDGFAVRQVARCTGRRTGALGFVMRHAHLRRGESGDGKERGCEYCEFLHDSFPPEMALTIGSQLLAVGFWLRAKG